MLFRKSAGPQLAPAQRAQWRQNFLSDIRRKLFFRVQTKFYLVKKKLRQNFQNPNEGPGSQCNNVESCVRYESADASKFIIVDSKTLVYDSNLP